MAVIKQIPFRPANAFPGDNALPQPMALSETAVPSGRSLERLSMVDGDGSTSRLDWRDPSSYDYTRHLTREGWAWEFLRRNPAYRAAFQSYLRDKSTIVQTQNAECTSTPEAAPWGLLAFRDPDRTALDSRVFWRPSLSPLVLSARAEPMPPTESVAVLDVEKVRCAYAAHQGRERLHLLFVDSGRRLQLSLQGGNRAERLRLLTDAVVDDALLERRMMLLRRLNALCATGTLPARLYPPDARYPRLRNILQTLDGRLAGAPQREIAARMFNPRWVDTDWSDPGDYLRDRVRRALRRGQCLMRGAYLSLLK